MKDIKRRDFLRSAALAGMSFPFLGHAHRSEPTHKDHTSMPPLNPPPTEDYLAALKLELNKQWPQNRAINLVFHGHSVPAGYFKTPVVDTLHAYPHLLLRSVKERYPYAVANAIVTAIGGEDSKKGADRFDRDVLVHRPDVLFIDYALNDQRIGLPAAREAWTRMIEAALNINIKVILLTATPDQRINISDPNTTLQQHCNQIVDLANKYKIGLIDSYKIFQSLVAQGAPITDYMSQVNHPNAKGHQLVADAIMTYF
ncbi:MAG: SGNH/GDSL hydrolase family protein [Chitinophagaceae bacterium]|nr:SGNH/GDSL hydrolase family protein [Chitinophagaceae bacterium]